MSFAETSHSKTFHVEDIVVFPGVKECNSDNSCSRNMQVPFVEKQKKKKNNFLKLLTLISNSHLIKQRCELDIVIFEWKLT